MTRRIISRVIESARNGVMNVDNDHMKTARDRIILPLNRLAAVAPITYKPNMPWIHSIMFRT